MPKTSAVRSPKAFSCSSSSNDGDGRDVGNIILHNLPREESDQLFPFLELCVCSFIRCCKELENRSDQVIS